MRDVSNSADVIDIREVIERFEELESELKDAHLAENDANDENGFARWVADTAENEAHTLQDAAIEFRELESLLEECCGNGGDEQWRGDWYPITLIRESYFEDYARELADDIGAIDARASWPNNCIDWEKAANELLQDYTSIDYAGVTYYTR